jgi:hypothetical protein
MNIPRSTGGKLPFSCWIRLISTPGNRVEVTKVWRGRETEYPSVIMRQVTFHLLDKADNHFWKQDTGAYTLYLHFVYLRRIV